MPRAKAAAPVVAPFAPLGGLWAGFALARLGAAATKEQAPHRCEACF